LSAHPILKPTIILADDNDYILKTVSRFLSSDFAVIGSALNGREAIGLALELQPQVLVLDVAMPVLDGLQVCTLLKLTTLNTKVIFLTTFTDGAMIQAAFRAGGRGVVFKACMQTDLPVAIAEVLAGRTFLSSMESQ
jgi:DNA-binding NarL/FixJ family response regulator